MHVVVAMGSKIKNGLPDGSKHIFFDDPDDNEFLRYSSWQYIVRKFREQKNFLRPALWEVDGLLRSEAGWKTFSYILLNSALFWNKEVNIKLRNANAEADRLRRKFF
ncbi:MAG: hypothetical protein ACU85E_18180 [Gammaproteobacteria bacterium]